MSLTDGERPRADGPLPWWRGESRLDRWLAGLLAAWRNPVRQHRPARETGAPDTARHHSIQLASQVAVQAGDARRLAGGQADPRPGASITPGPGRAGSAPTISGPRPVVIEPTPAGTQRRIRALMNRSWSPPAIEAATGIPAEQITSVLADRSTVSPLLASEVAVAYEALWNREPPRRTPGERQAADAARELADASGWPPPAAWDDDQIDLPAGRPAPGWKRTRQLGRSADMAEDVAFLRETGYQQAPTSVLALRLGLPAPTLERALIRHAKRTAARDAASQHQAEPELEAG